MDALTTHCLHLDPEVRAIALKRMRSVKGHLDGIVRMLEAPRPKQPADFNHRNDLVLAVERMSGRKGAYSNSMLTSAFGSAARSSSRVTRPKSY